MRLGVDGAMFSSSLSSISSSRPISSSDARLLLFMPLGGGAALLVIFFLDIWLVVVSSLRVRNRSLKGEAGISACVVGGDGRGDGSRFCVVIIDCSARQVE